MKNYDDVMKELGEAFDKCPEMPESLSKENIVKSIKEKNITPKPKKTGFGAEIAAAAVSGIVIVAVLAATGGFRIGKKPDNQSQNVSQAIVTSPVTQAPAVNAEPESKPEKEPVKVEGVESFESPESVEEYFLNIYRDRGAFNNYWYGYNDTLTGEIVTVGATMAPAANGNAADNSYIDSTSKGESLLYGQTNVQTKGVDEGDIIKNDGRYLYFVSGNYHYEKRLKILDTESMTVVYSGIIGEKSDDTESYVEELYVNGNTMTVIYSQTKNRQHGEYHYSDIDIAVEVYDITNKSAPKKISTNVQNGTFVSSRRIGDVLYTISSYRVLGTDEEVIKESCIPQVNGSIIGCDCIYFHDDESTSYTVITALDTSKPEERSTSLAILGRANDIYCSQNTLYYFETDYTREIEKTVITSFALDGTRVTLKAKGEVTGRYNNNYSFDEYNGYLRCATTSYDIGSYKDVSSIYVLNDKLEVVGACENISDNEQVKSVRFMGDKGYVVTFRNTDPLFSLDLSDPENPKVTGELKLPGYSTYLHPLGNDLLMGIGYGGDEESADTSKLKLALFDISDMTKPELVDEYVISSAGSEANYNPKALVHFSEKTLIGIPVQVNRNILGVYTVYRSFAMIDYSDNKLSEITGFKHSSESGYAPDFFRGTYIDDRLYTVDGLTAVEHSLESGEKLREVEVVTDSEKKEYEMHDVVTKGDFFDWLVD